MKQHPQSPDGIEARLRQLEQQVSSVLELVARLKKEKAELAARLAEAACIRRELENRLDSLIDKLDSPS